MFESSYKQITVLFLGVHPFQNPEDIFQFSFLKYVIAWTSLSLKHIWNLCCGRMSVVIIWWCDAWQWHRLQCDLVSQYLPVNCLPFLNPDWWCGLCLWLVDDSDALRGSDEVISLEIHFPFPSMSLKSVNLLIYNRCAFIVTVLRFMGTVLFLLFLLLLLLREPFQLHTSP